MGIPSASHIGLQSRPVPRHSGRPNRRISTSRTYPLYPEIDSLYGFTFEMSDHLPLWIQLDTWIEDEQFDSMLERLGDAG